MTSTSTRRRYDSTLRRERANATRERIIAAGADLLRGAPIRDWDAVTIRAVAERAAVNERTVYRHFANERALRDAVIHRLEQDAGIALEQMQLGDVADVMARVIRLVSQHPIGPGPALDPTLAEANRRQHEALLGAVTAHTARWSGADRTVVAAMLDVLWAVSSYERLARDWGLDAEEAVRAMAWVIGLVEDAVRDGRRPSRPKRTSNHHDDR